MGSQLAVDPTNEIALRDISNKKIETHRDLVQMAVSEWESGQMAVVYEIGARARVLGLAIVAAFEMPVACKFRAGCVGARGRLDIGPRYIAMLFHKLLGGAG